MATTSIGSIATPEERAEMKQAIRDALQASGKYDELVAKAREALIDCGWGEQMAAMARSKYLNLLPINHQQILFSVGYSFDSRTEVGWKR